VENTRWKGQGEVCFHVRRGSICPLLSFSSNSTFIMLYLYHVMDVSYLVVEEMRNIKIVLLHLPI
jgi:hypothetical protein